MTVDWKKAEREYITSNITLREMAKEYGTNLSTMRDHCKRGEWVNKREEYAHKVHTKAIQKSAETLGNAQEDFDRQMALALSMLMEKTVEDISNAENIAERRIAVGNLKMIGEIMQSNKSFPRKMEEMQKRIDKMQAETKAIEDGTQVDHDVTIRFENAEWMEDDDNSTNTDSQAN